MEGSMKKAIAILFSLVAAQAGAGKAERSSGWPRIDPAKVEIRATKVAGGVWMLVGLGGNIGVSAGEDGVFVVDDQFAPLGPKIREAIAQISGKPLRFVLNTHWHGDHTGGNEPMAEAGALIVAQDNVRRRMSVDQFLEVFGGQKVPAAPLKALPVVTFSQEVTFHLNGDEIHVSHVRTAHTDGDVIVHFRRANVVHTGDVFLHGSYPIIDYSTGGTVDGSIAGLARVLQLANADTKIIPGHGPLADRAAVQAAHDMLVKVRERVAELVAQGKTLEEVQAAKPTKDFDDQWAKSFLKPDVFVMMVYKTLPGGAPGGAKAP
jgi:glyoxylase-like metal-dependent hydrolase (beta-lactamase superfamily II)